MVIQIPLNGIKNKNKHNIMCVCVMPLHYGCLENTQMLGHRELGEEHELYYKQEIQDYNSPNVGTN